MRKRNFRYYCRMVVKTLILIIPIFAIFCSLITQVLPQGAQTFNYFLSDFSSFNTILLGLPINSWYSALIDIFGFDELFTGDTVAILLALPLYFIWVEVFDLVLHLVFFFTDLFHKFLGAEK